MTGELTFIELGVEDADKGREFYEALFGWRFDRGPSGSGWKVTAPNVAGGMHGGDKGAQPYAFFAVDDIEAAAAKVRELGGEIDDSMDLDGDEEMTAQFGRFKLCRDNQGSAFGLHQPPG